MSRPTRQMQKAVVEQWKRAAPALAETRRAELAAWQYDWTTVDALLEIGARDSSSRPTSGLIAMQSLFRKAAASRR